MDTLILNSVIEITRQRDLDSLELSLVTLLAEHVPVYQITLYKLFHDSRMDKLEEVIQLRISENNQSGKTYTWSNEKRTITADEHLQQCLQSATGVHHTAPDGTRHLLYPVFLEDRVAGALCLLSREDLSSRAKMIDVLTRIYSNYLTILNESERDKLTGLLNRRTFDNKLNKLLEIQRYRQTTCLNTDSKPDQRHHEPVHNPWLAMLDIDHFKRINDTYGHLFGDEVILMLSQKIRQSFRNTDLLFRFGGEEFVIVLEPIPADMARQTFERFCRTVSDHPFPQVGKITISIGYAMINAHDYPHVILERADKALYYAKEHGRDCVFNYDDLLARGQLSEHHAAPATVLFGN